MYDGDGRKKAEKQKVTKSRKKFPVWLPSPPPVYEKWRPAVVRCRKTPKRSRTYPMWDWGPSLVGQRNDLKTRLLTAVDVIAIVS